MLQVGAIEPATLALLKQLMRVPELHSFVLVGGTALALRYGHRKSVDLDLFSHEPMQKERIAAALQREFAGRNVSLSQNTVGVFAYIDNIKVDIVDYSYFKLIGEPETVDGIRIASDKDLVAMKVNAVLRRAVKKDYYDIAELLQHYSLQDFIDFYNEKYPSQQVPIAIPTALTFFEDAHGSETPISLRKQTWQAIQKLIRKQVNSFLL